jgi:hypothetical protein
MNSMPLSMNTMTGVSPKTDFSLDLANFGTMQANPSKSPQIDFLSMKSQTTSTPTQPGNLL